MPGASINFRGSRRALNRYEAFIRERCLFHFNVNKTNKMVVFSWSKIENKVCE